eukprot:gene23569-28579_t
MKLVALSALLVFLWEFLSLFFSPSSASSTASKNRRELQEQPIARAHHGRHCRPTPFLPPFRRREDIGLFLQESNFKIGVELGVQRGFYTRDLLSKWRTADKYVLVDLWAQQENYLDGANVANRIHEKYMAESIANAQNMKNQGFVKEFVVCRNYTVNCALDYPDFHFDFIYVDARHDYKGVLLDIRTWWPKLKFGGVMAGDDYAIQSEVAGNWSVNFDGTVDYTGRIVRGAVDDFFSDRFHDLKGCPRQVTVSYRENPHYLNTWAVRK